MLTLNSTRTHPKIIAPIDISPKSGALKLTKSLKLEVPERKEAADTMIQVVIY